MAGAQIGGTAGAPAGIAAARRAVQDDIEDRRFAFGGAVQYLIRTAVTQGRVDDEMAWIELQKPGAFDVDASQIPGKLRKIQRVALDGWAETLPHDEVLRRLDAVLANAATMGVDLTEDPSTHISILVLRGQVDEAIEVALNEIFSESVAVHLDWRDMLLQPRYASLLEDQRIQQAIQRWEDEEAALRGSVESYFEDMHAAR